MSFTADDIAKIVSSVVDQLESGKRSVPSPVPPPKVTVPSSAGSGGGYRGCYTEIPTCVARGTEAYQKFKRMSLNERENIIRKIREICLQNLDTLARMAWEETGMGRWQDKLEKNRLVIEKTPGTEDLQPIAYSGDFGLTLREWGAYGVIGSITPTTNPTETIINNSISMIAAGNAVVFNPHPRAKKCCAYAVDLINQAVQACGGPADLVTIMQTPTMESGQELMTHPGVKILVVTGGPGIVKAAFSAGKKVIAAGPGNPPAVVDETADIDAAAKHIISGATLDNNILCIAEKEVLVVDSVADELIQAMKRHHGYQVIGSNIRKLEQLIYQDGKMNADMIGQNAAHILAQVGIQAPESTRLAFFETDFEHFLVKKEQMMPVMPIVRCPNVDVAIERAVEAEKGNFHTATIHSRNLDVLHKMAVESNVSILVKNGPSYAGLGMGGEGFTTMTIAGPTGEGADLSSLFYQSATLYPERAL